MSVTIIDTPLPTRSQDWAPQTVDIESTTDIHEENTSDLSPVTLPATEDVMPEAMPRTKDTPEPAAPAPTPPREPQRAERRVNAPEPTQSIATPQETPPRQPEPAARHVERPLALAPGAVLNDRYLLEQVIGCGGTSIVYRARDMLSSKGTQPNSQVAIKTPRPEFPDRARATTRLKHEYELARRLSHPNIVHVFELHEDAQRCFMSMELIQGRLLSTLIRDWTMLSPPLTRKILRDCAQALSHAHDRGVVHGDFKPDNVFVTAQERIKIVDFGAAASVPIADSSRIHAGTPTYASPEVLSGQSPEQRDDVFSFACVAYELLTGQHPFERRSSLQAREEARVPPRAWSLSATQWLGLLSALSWERAKRPADIDSLLNALTAEGPAASETAPVHAPEAAAAAELPADLMPPQRSWGFFIFIACALVVTFIFSQRKLDEQTPDTGTTIAVPPTSLSAPPAKTSITGPAPSRPVEQNAAPAPAAAEKKPEPAAAAPKPAATAAPAAAPARAKPVAMSEISFESRSVVTSESSVSAVFLIKRSQPLSGRVKVSWNAVSGSADAGIDFASNASGSVEFADGQAQRAIYVPLRNDLLPEGDETFTVRLHTPQQARIGSVARIEATIRDDD